MFTVCPKCMLTLAVTAADLRMGQGYVRCGRCANVFNALLTLSEEPVEEQSAPATAADPASQSQISAALREDRTAQAGEPTPADSPEPGTDLSTAAEPAAESAESGIESDSTFAAGTGTFETIVLEGEAITQTEEFVPEESVDSEIASLTRRLAASARRSGSPVPVEEPPPAADAGPAQSVVAAVANEAPAEAIEAVSPKADTGPDMEADAEGIAPVASTAPRPNWPWVTGSSALVVLLLVQVVHHWRDSLATHAALAGPLTSLYASLGMPLDPHWDLSAYDVRQQGAAADGTDSELVHVRLSLANHAQRPQPLPMLRLTLLDRYGKRIARGNLAPAQYWPGGEPPHPLLAHDERVDCEVVVRDPGAASASFELDVCLRDAAGQLRCASDLPSK